MDVLNSDTAAARPIRKIGIKTSGLFSIRSSLKYDLENEKPAKEIW
jgi:hypothetical protein